MFNKLPDNSNNFLQTDLPLVYTVIISYNPTFVKNKYLVEFSFIWHSLKSLLTNSESHSW